MSVLRNPWWWVTVAVFVVHQLLQRLLSVDIGLLDGYLDPFCAAPILLGLLRMERQLVFRVPQLSGLETATATLVLAILFEEVFPRYGEGFRHDALDYLFYGLGGVYFYFLINNDGPADAVGTDGSDRR